MTDDTENTKSIIHKGMFMELPPGNGTRSPSHPPQQQPQDRPAPSVPFSGDRRHSPPPAIAPQFRSAPSPQRPPDSGRNSPEPPAAAPACEPRPPRVFPASDATGPQYALLDPIGDVLRIGLGIALLAVPVVAVVFAYLLPTIRTVQLSRIENLGVFGPADTVGPGNYDEVFAQGRFAESLAQIAGPTAVMVVLGAVVAPLAAWVLHRAGTRVRTAAAIGSALAAIAFAPAALTVARLVDRVAAGTEHEASAYDWVGLISGVVLGLGVLAALAALRGAAARRAPAVLVTAGLVAFAVTAAGLQTFAFSIIAGLPRDVLSPVAQIYDGLYSGLAPGGAAVKSVFLLAILAALGIGAAVLFLAARTRIDVAPAPDDRAEPHRAASIAGIAVLVLLLAAIGYLLLPWITRVGEGTSQGEDLWFVIRRTWGPPLVTTAIALPVAAVGGFAIGALRPFGDASRRLLLLFAPWLFTGSGPLGAANLEAVAGEGEYMVIGSFPARAWIAIPLLFLFTALFWGLEDRRRAALAEGTPPEEARRAFLAAAWPMVALLAPVLLLVNAQDLFWQQLTFQDMLTAGAMTRALQNLDFAHSGVGLGFPLPILAVYVIGAVAAARWYLPRLAIKVGRD
jgi:hypothetical protein